MIEDPWIEAVREAKTSRPCCDQLLLAAKHPIVLSLVASSHSEEIMPVLQQEPILERHGIERPADGLMALKKGRRGARLPLDWTGVAGKVADAFNDVVELNERMAGELERLSRVVGKEGKLGQRLISATSTASGRSRSSRSMT